MASGLVSIAGAPVLLVVDSPAIASLGAIFAISPHVTERYGDAARGIVSSMTAAMDGGGSPVAPGIFMRSRFTLTQLSCHK